jgi:hypothetical protein
MYESDQVEMVSIHGLYREGQIGSVALASERGSGTPGATVVTPSVTTTTLMSTTTTKG